MNLIFYRASSFVPISSNMRTEVFRIGSLGLKWKGGNTSSTTIDRMKNRDSFPPIIPHRCTTAVRCPFIFCYMLSYLPGVTSTPPARNNSYKSPMAACTYFIRFRPSRWQCFNKTRRVPIIQFDVAPSEILSTVRGLFHIFENRNARQSVVFHKGASIS